MKTILNPNFGPIPTKAPSKTLLAPAYVWCTVYPGFDEADPRDDTKCCPTSEQW